MEELLSEMSADMLQQNLKALENFSKQAIDLIDRNLFERAADVRWWSTDHAFWEALQNNTDENFEEASKRLGDYKRILHHVSRFGHCRFQRTYCC